MTFAPQVSVILATYNRLNYLRAAVDSVISQTFQDWEFIIADDGSEADTIGYLKSLAAIPNITVLFLPHSGNPSAVRNAACRVAKGRFLAFLDSDDVWLRH
jgi:glycosyltransferase involved in cell wall biosynthesis